MIAAANARQAACGWDANGSPTVEEPPRAPRPAVPILVEPPRASPALRGFLSLLAAMGGHGIELLPHRRGRGTRRRRW